MEGIGAQLHAARARWGLTLREVEERSNLLAQRCGNPAFKISAIWLDRVERENRELSAAKLIVLAYIYIRSDYRSNVGPLPRAVREPSTA
jgi:transcriptional regulator with XRE-family HTH domain